VLGRAGDLRTAIAGSGFRLRVSNLHYNVTEEELRVCGPPSPAASS